MKNIALFALADIESILCLLVLIFFACAAFRYAVKQRIFLTWISWFISFLVFLFFSLSWRSDSWHTPAAITIICYFLFFCILIRLYIKVAVCEQLKKEFQLYDSKYEIVKVDPQSFGTLSHKSVDSKCEIVQIALDEFVLLNLEFYNNKQRELETLGFVKIGDIERIHLSRIFPRERNFIRLFLSGQKNIIAEISQVRYDISLISTVDIRQIIFRSEFSDGTFFETNNTLMTNLLDDFDGLISHRFESDKSINEMFEFHISEIDKMREEKKVNMIFYENFDEVIESDKREFSLFCNYRKKQGGCTEKELKQILKVGNDKTEQKIGIIARAYIREYSRQLNRKN